ncbi:hypothetical protein GALL_79930 [mine drainage metagenome]|uniref:Uncharacterized protein n=1 Tax=mine drainage metagenome TaxID=410659 RepID=A0A1J5SNK9_9ZZZZ
MLTLDEIEDSYEVAFLHAAEDLSDEQLQLMMGNVRELRRHAPPSLAVSEARVIIAAILEKRHPAPEPPPPPEDTAPADAEPQSDAAPALTGSAPALTGSAPALTGSEEAATAGPDDPENGDTAPESAAEAALDAEARSPLSPARAASPTLDLLTTPFRRAMTWFFGE